MPEGEGARGRYVTVAECSSHIAHIKSIFKNIEEDVDRNAETNDKILMILQGNGEGGLIWKVNSLMQRNHFIDKAFSVALSVLTTLLTLWLSGALNL